MSLPVGGRNQGVPRRVSYAADPAQRGSMSMPMAGVPEQDTGGGRRASALNVSCRHRWRRRPAREAERSTTLYSSSFCSGRCAKGFLAPLVLPWVTGGRSRNWLL